MIIITDNISYSLGLFKDKFVFNNLKRVVLNDEVKQIAEKFIPCKELLCYEHSNFSGIDYCIVTESSEESQYDILADLMKENALKHNVICFAGSGKKFHGFRERTWISLQGNIHLSIFLRPDRKIEMPNVAFLTLATVAIVKAIDSIEGLEGKSKIKWVNDVYIENKKVGGVLSYSQMQGNKTTGVLLGIGLNVEASPPDIKDNAIGSAGCLNDFLSTKNKIKIREILKKLLDNLLINYSLVLYGNSKELFDFYKKRLMGIGEEVKIISDPINGISSEKARGKFVGIGDNLELFIESQKEPIIEGRMILNFKKQ